MSTSRITRNLSVEATDFLLFSPRQYHQIENSLRILQRCRWNGRDLRPGDTVEIGIELDGTAHERQGRFFLIYWILQDSQHGTIRFRGLAFERASLQGAEALLPEEVNEVLLKLRVNADDVRSPFDQNLIEITLNDIVTIRELRLTNARFPTISFRDRLPHNQGDHTVWQEEVLVCRWLMVSYYKDAAAMRAERLCQLIVRHFEEAEVPDTFRVSDAALRV